MKFSSKQICPACNYYFNNKVTLDEKLNLMNKIIKKSKTNNKNFDCIIGVSGGKDSVRQALWVRDKLKLKPLLACLAYPPEQVSIRGVNNISNLINLGFDVIISSIGPKSWKKMMKYSFLKFSNWAKSTEAALFSFVPQLAIRYQIPLIFWGENVSSQIGDTGAKSKNGYDGNKLRYINTLAGGNLNFITKNFKKKINTFPYKYPTIKEFKKNKIQIIYLGWFWDDWSLKNNAKISIINGLEIRENKFKNYGDIFQISSLDEDWVTINQLIKYYKYGFGKASEYIIEDVRHGLITRAEGIKLIEKYDDNYSNKILKSFCNYINISENFFWTHIKKNCNKKLFRISGNKITPKFKVGYDLA
jgi:N-acetyl sugar amidotransferase